MADCGLYDNHARGDHAHYFVLYKCLIIEGLETGLRHYLCLIELQPEVGVQWSQGRKVCIVTRLFVYEVRRGVTLGAGMCSLGRPSCILTQSRGGYRVKNTEVRDVEGASSGMSCNICQSHETIRNVGRFVSRMRHCDRVEARVRVRLQFDVLETARDLSHLHLVSCRF